MSWLPWLLLLLERLEACLPHSLAAKHATVGGRCQWLCHVCMASSSCCRRAVVHHPWMLPPARIQTLNPKYLWGDRDWG